ncbi:MAG: MBL fold metallo-hydrolase [Eubacteriales bacterium]|nr:MBL fold metallo-hydrolase [Eubacteriales bacterium]MDD4512094.1 MBL fold metallo-hydrolase [Eubacteriales bacterium]
MSRICDITYYFHSGFSVAIDDTFLLFDYWLGEEGDLPQEVRLTESRLAKYKNVIIFVSHCHPDHYDEAIYDFRALPNVTYIISADAPVGSRGKRMARGDKLTIGNVNITAYGSTDPGVSYLAEIDGMRFFHAGDLNFWHWRKESTLKEIEKAEADFGECLKELDGVKMDVAFFPVDPRMGEMYDAGATTFIYQIKPRLLFPMHWQRRAEVAVDFARRQTNRNTEIVALTKAGQNCRCDFTETEISLRISSFKRREEEDEAEKAAILFEHDEMITEEERKPSRIAEAVAKAKEKASRQPSDEASTEFDPDDPFHNTDLPVKL